MTGWAWITAVIGYLAVALLTARLFVRADLERVARRELATRRDAARKLDARDHETVERWVAGMGPLVTQRQRDDAIASALIMGVTWPMVAMLAAVDAVLRIVGWLTIMATTGARRSAAGFVPPAERERLAVLAAARDRQELECLRKQARDLDLPFPGGDQ